MHVVVNAAISVDGKLSSRRREQIAISGPEDFARVDRLRAESDAVMVGVGTVLADDPSLTLDDERDGSTNPARVVADSRGSTPTDARILDGRATTYLLASDAIPDDRRAALTQAGATVIVAGEERTDLSTALDVLAERGIEQLMVEGGGELLFSLFAAGLVDELRVFVGPTVIGGRDAPTLVDGDGFVDEERFPTLTLRDIEPIDDGVVLYWDVPE